MAEQLKAATSILETITDKPAMDLTPENMAQRIDQAARKGRQSDREQITAAENRYDHAMRELTKVAASAHSAADQRTLLKWAGGGGMLRSEEHTSELQSLMRISYAVFCLKKKKKQKR